MPKIIPVRLTRAMLWKAAELGCARNIASLIAGRVPGHGLGNDPHWNRNIEGYIGEVVVAAVFNLPIGGINTFGKPDVGHYQVRTRFHRKDRRMIIWPSDRMTENFISVYRSEPLVYWIQGWRRAGECRRAEWASDMERPNSDCWKVPVNELRDCEELLVNAAV